jgi:exosortase/archaeosortase family protein
MNVPLKYRKIIFIIIAAILAIIQNPLRIIGSLTPEYFTLNAVYPFVILFLCVVFLYAKRHEIHDEKPSLIYAISGAGMISGSFFLPAVTPEFEIFRLLLALTGLAFLFFGEAASLPALLLCIFGFGISFPKLVDAYIGIAYAQFSTKIAYSIGSLFIPATQGDTAISMITLSGERLIMIINAACSGSASMSVFLVIFMLMSLDLPLPKRKLAYMLVFGIIGTSVQNIFRLVILMLAGYYWGPSAVESGESFAGYVIFPLWYAVFALVYLKQAKRYVSS